MAISRLRPLGVKLDFGDRSYKLGETIDITVELNPRGDVEVREGRVDLVCEVRWREISTVKVVASRGAIPQPASGRSAPPAVWVTKQVTKERKETYVHSTVVFLTNTHLHSGAPGRYNARLDIQPEPPAHAAEGTVKWQLLTTIDVAGARDFTRKRKVQVTVD